MPGTALSAAAGRSQRCASTGQVPAKSGTKGMTMRKTACGMILALAALAISACAPLVVGGAVAVVADEVIEQENGGDGLF